MELLLRASMLSSALLLAKAGLHHSAAHVYLHSLLMDSSRLLEGHVASLVDVEAAQNDRTAAMGNCIKASTALLVHMQPLPRKLLFTQAAVYAKRPESLMKG